MKYKIFAGICLVFVGIFAATSFYYKKEQARLYGEMARDNASVFVRDYSWTLGSPDAKVTIVEFMDPACETCAAFSPIVKKMMDANPGKIKLVLRYAPFHNGADNFVKILEAAGKQGKYWETLKIMFASQSQWASHSNPQPQRIWEFLPQVGLDLDRLKTDMNDPEIAKRIEQDLADARTLNVRKTPGFFVNGKPLEPFGSKQLYQLVQSQLKAAY